MTETPEAPETTATAETAVPPVPAGAVLLCYDGSDTSKHAIAVAHEVLGARPALVLHLWEPPGAAAWMTTDAFGGMPTWGVEMTELDAVLRERSGRLLADGVRIAREAGFDARGRLEVNPGAEWRAILDIADEIAAKVVVVGARGLSAVQSALLGSISNAVVHHAKRPVLVVPAVS